LKENIEQLRHPGLKARIQMLEIEITAEEVTHLDLDLNAEAPERQALVRRGIGA
jgi:hypothetical protein